MGGGDARAPGTKATDGKIATDSNDAFHAIAELPCIRLDRLSRRRRVGLVRAAMGSQLVRGRTVLFHRIKPVIARFPPAYPYY